MKNILVSIMVLIGFLSCSREEVDFTDDILGIWLPVSQEASFCDDPFNQFFFSYDLNGCINSPVSVTCDQIEFREGGDFLRNSVWTPANGQSIPTSSEGRYGLSGNSLTLTETRSISGTVSISGDQLNFSYRQSGFDCSIVEIYRRRQ